jgi:hypothetical protein
MPSQHDVSGPSDPNDPYKSSRLFPDEGSPSPPRSPSILWIIPGSFLSLLLFGITAGYIGETFHEAAMVPLIGGWLALLGWSLWITARGRAETISIFARSYLLANALVALLVGVVGTTCSGMSFGATSGGSGMAFLWILLCVLAVSIGLFAFRWPRKP